MHRSCRSGAPPRTQAERTRKASPRGEACSQADGDIGSVLAMSDELQNIVDSVQRVSDRLAQIATADEVSGNIQQVDQAAGQLLDGAQAVSHVAEQLRRGSEGLAQNTGRFTLG